MSDLGFASEPVHRSRDGVAPMSPHTSDGRWLGWRKIMSKTNDTSNMNTERELTSDELDTVSGGVDVCRVDPFSCIVGQIISALLHP
jgi:hypothetical protein